MTFKESIESLTFNSDWKSFIDENFDRKSGVYQYLIYTETKIEIDKKYFNLPTKIVFKSDYQRFRMKDSKISEFEYKSKKYKLTEINQIIPFGTFERKYKFSGSFSEIINDLLSVDISSECLCSNKLLETGNYPLYGIDSNIKYPSYLIEIKNNQQFSKRKSTLSFDNLELVDEEKDAVKEILHHIGINYEPNDVKDNSTFIIFPLPYILIVENRLNTKGENEKISLTLEFNRNFYNVFKSNKIELQYDIADIDKKKNDNSKIEIVFDGKLFVDVTVEPKGISKIGLCKLKVFIDNIEVNQFQGTYIRGFKINTKIVGNE